MQTCRLNYVISSATRANRGRSKRESRSLRNGLPPQNPNSHFQPPRVFRFECRREESGVCTLRAGSKGWRRQATLLETRTIKIISTERVAQLPLANKGVIFLIAPKENAWLHCPRQTGDVARPKQGVRVHGSTSRLNCWRPWTRFTRRRRRQRQRRRQWAEIKGTSGQTTNSQCSRLIKRARRSCFRFREWNVVGTLSWKTPAKDNLNTPGHVSIIRVSLRPTPTAPNSSKLSG